MSSNALLKDDIARRTKELLSVLGLTQIEMASEVGVSQTFVSAVASGRSLPSLPLVAGLCRTFAVSLHWYLWGEGEPFEASGRAGGIAPSVMNRGERRPVTQTPNPVPDDLQPLVGLLCDLHQRPGGRRMIGHLQLLAEHELGREAAERPARAKSA